MSVIFISYADGNMSYSLKRIGRQARRLGIFDEIILYTPEMLPDYIRNSALMQYPRGGGYWSWKPAILTETLLSSSMSMPAAPSGKGANGTCSSACSSDTTRSASSMTRRSRSGRNGEASPPN